ncbi:hypothetical protein [Anaerobacillus alkalilacustris]|nr:hypothetical protein [Anaerobacillus alkalilacustris]
MPAKPSTNDLLNHINFCNQLIDIIKKDEQLYVKEDVKLKAHLFRRDRK